MTDLLKSNAKALEALEKLYSAARTYKGKVDDYDLIKEFIMLNNFALDLTGLKIQSYKTQDGFDIQFSGDGWAVRDMGYRLNNKTLEFDYEPLPSSRTDEWIIDHIFSTVEEANSAAFKSKHGDVK